jgi:hypothetical protein
MRMEIRRIERRDCEGMERFGGDDDEIYVVREIDDIMFACRYWRREIDMTSLSSRFRFANPFL